MRRVTIGALVTLLVAVGWYLRDPPWLINQSTGLRPAEQAPDGRTFRWTGGHASFFVPSKALAIRIPVATTFDAGGRSAMMVTVFVDDTRAVRVLLIDEAWQTVTVPLPPPGSRRVRRIDIRTSVVRDDNHGVKVGAIEIEPRSSAYTSGRASSDSVSQQARISPGVRRETAPFPPPT